MLEAIIDNTSPRGIYLADFGVNSKPCRWVLGKRAKYILSLFFLILKRTISGECAFSVHYCDAICFLLLKKPYQLPFSSFICL